MIIKYCRFGFGLERSEVESYLIMLKLMIPSSKPSFFVIILLVLLKFLYGENKILRQSALRFLTVYAG